MFGKKWVFVLAVALSFSAVGCKKKTSIVDHVSFKPSDDLTMVHVSVVFKNNIRSNMDGIILTDYGQFFINPYTIHQPFEIGFDLDMQVFNAPEYAGLKETMTLPNGVPIGIPYPLVEIQSTSRVDEKYDIYGYVDMKKKSWLGAAAVFNFMNDNNFPPELALSAVFLRDKNGNPGVMTTAFGPSLKPDGTIARNGGIALFANIRQLMKQFTGHGPTVVTLYAETQRPVLRGKNAHGVSDDGLRILESRLIKGLNGRLQ